MLMQSSSAQREETVIVGRGSAKRCLLKKKARFSEGTRDITLQWCKEFVGMLPSVAHLDLCSISAQLAVGVYSLALQPHDLMQARHPFHVTCCVHDRNVSRFHYINDAAIQSGCACDASTQASACLCVLCFHHASTLWMWGDLH
eukprot:3580266-Amphidinium_carterae.1